MLNTAKIFLFLALFVTLEAASQQSIFGGQDIQSPEIGLNNTVIFRILAPEAKEVKLSGDWMPAQGWTPGTEAMTKNENGVWTYTTSPLLPELYSYFFIVDGIRTPDLNNPFLIRDVASVTNIFLIEDAQSGLYKVKKVPHGTVRRSWYDAPSLGMQRRITIYTPPGYEESNEKYPVLYLLHGAGGDEEAWISLGRTAQIMDNLIALGKAKPMIVVMPNGNVIQDAAPGEGSDGFYKPQFMVAKTMDGTYEAGFSEIITYVETHFRAESKKSSRAIAGLSMGGFHAMHISRYYPDTFDYIGLFSAAILPAQGAQSKVYEAIDVTLMKQKELGFKLYWIGMGKTDFLYQSGVDFRKKLDSMSFPYSYYESEGGHIWKNWRNYLSDFVPLLF